MLANVENRAPEMDGHTLEQANAAWRTIENRFGLKGARESLARLGCGKMGEVPSWGLAELVRFSKFDAGNTDDFCATLWTESVDFLQKLRPGGPWLLVAISPDNGVVGGRTVKTAEEARTFVQTHNGSANIYYSVNPIRTAISKKPSKGDIAQIEYVLADLDPNADEIFRGREEPISGAAYARWI